MYDREVIGDVFFDESYERHEDYIFWLSMLKRGIVAKGNPLDHNSCTTLSVFQHSLFYIKQVGYMEAHFSSRHKGICTY